MRKSIFIKVFGGYALIILISSAMILGFSFAKIRSHYQETLALELENLGHALNVNVLPFMESGRVQELDAFLKKIGKDIHARVTVIDPQGTVLADSDRDPHQMENHKYRPEVSQALEGKTGRSLRFSVTVEEKMLYVGQPLEQDGRIVGVLRLSMFMKNIDILLHGLRTTIGRVVIFAAFFSLFLALFLSLHFLRPIQKLTRAARQVAGGNFETKVTIRHKDEFRELGAAFNLMTGRIHQLFADVSRRKEELVNIIESIQEGLLVVDGAGRILLANESFKKLISEKAPEGRFHWEMIRNPGIQECITSVQAGHGLISKEVRLNEKYVLCTAGGLSAQGGIVLTLHDMSEVRRIEILKKDFIINASHELRTPLAAIAGAVETLEGGTGSENKRSWDILRRHADRLRNIVDDLLKLSELEDKNYKLDIQDVDVRQSAQNVLEIYTPRIKKKGLTARLDAPPALPFIKGDSFQIEQMLMNLIDNAVKYTEKGSIEVSLKTEAKDFIIEIRDSGLGISAEHLPRLFERFYVVDKSRSRKLGGTGLGLAIVKHIVQLHSGTITVESAEGHGTIFFIRLPLSFPSDVPS